MDERKESLNRIEEVMEPVYCIQIYNNFYNAWCDCYKNRDLEKVKKEAEHHAAWLKLHYRDIPRIRIVKTVEHTEVLWEKDGKD